MFKGENMQKLVKAALAAAALTAAPAAYAQEEESDFTISGDVTLTSQYRLRGISQSDEKIALQGGITVTHASGFYFGTWGSSLAGYGSYGGGNVEVDLIGGYSTAIGNVTLDGGLIYYIYPGAPGATNFLDIYASVTAPLGPVEATVGAFYAPSSDALGNQDNIWVYGDLAVPIADTPFTLKGHIGYTSGSMGGPTGDYIDYALGVDVTFDKLTLNISYIDTDISNRGGIADAFFGCVGCKRGRSIVDGAVVATLSASF